MLDSQRIALKLSEARQALNGCIEERNKLGDKAPSDELVSKMDEGTRLITRLETEYRAAVTKEDGDEKRDEARNEADNRIDKSDQEARELRRLELASSIFPFLIEAVDGTPVAGREKEYRQAVLGDEARAGLLPIDLLQPPLTIRPVDEHRVDAVTPVTSAAIADGSSASVLERIFARSVAARAGVAMPTVPAGNSVYPIMTAGTTAAQAADTTVVDATAGAFTGHTLAPIRLTAAYLFNLRQTLELRGFEDVLRRDLRAVMTDKMDNDVMNGNGTAPNVTGFLAELPAPTAPSSVTSWQQFIASFVDQVDGLNAYGLADLRAIVGPNTFRFANKLYPAAAIGSAPRESAYEYMRQRVGGLSVSSRIPYDSGDKQQTNLIALTSYPGRNAVAPVWRGMEIIRDPYSNAAAGQVRLTAIMFWNFKVLREAGWKLSIIQDAA